MTPWTAGRQAPLSLTTSQSLLKVTSTGSVMPSNHLILRRPLLLLPSTFPSIGVFPSELALHITWPGGFSISSSSEYSGLISFRIDGFQSWSLKALHLIKQASELLRKKYRRIIRKLSYQGKCLKQGQTPQTIRQKINTFNKNKVLKK